MTVLLVIALVFVGLALYFWVGLHVLALFERLERQRFGWDDPDDDYWDDDVPFVLYVVVWPAFAAALGLLSASDRIRSFYNDALATKREPEPPFDPTARMRRHWETEEQWQRRLEREDS